MKKSRCFVKCSISNSSKGLEQYLLFAKYNYTPLNTHNYTPQILNSVSKLPWYTIVYQRNSKLDTITANKASSSKTKNTPQNSRKQSRILKMQAKPNCQSGHCKTCTTLSMRFQDMPALPSRKDIHLTSRQEKLAEQKIRTSV